MDPNSREVDDLAKRMSGRTVNFNSEVDGDRVFEGGLWSFESEALVLQKWEAGMRQRILIIRISISLYNYIAYGLPFELRRDESARTLVEQIGIIREHKDNGRLKDTVNGKVFLRYQIEVDTTKPILPGFFSERMGMKPT